MKAHCSTIYVWVVFVSRGLRSNAPEQLGHQVAAVPDVGDEHVPRSVANGQCRT